MQNLTSIIDAIGWALLSSLWQSSVIAIRFVCDFAIVCEVEATLRLCFSYLMLVLCVSASLSFRSYKVLR